MVQLNKNNITNQYLYGQLTTPANLVDDSLIRPKNATTEVEVDVVEFMATGAGRFAVGSQFTLVQRFFAPFLTSPPVPPGRYTKAELGVITGLDTFTWNMQQYNWEDDIDDYFDRVWVYNSMVFSISEDAVFIVEADGSKRIENFAILPREDVQENFDLVSDDGLTGIANSIVKPYIDPWGIGRKVNINFSVSDLIPRTTYTSQDFANDLIRINDWSVSTPEALAKIALNQDNFVDGLFDDGVTKFLSGNKPIIYGSPDADNLIASNIDFSSDPPPFGLNQAPLLAPYVDNGLVMLAGNGDDKIAGLGGDDIFIGGSGNDTIEGGSSWFGFVQGTDTAVYKGALSDYDIEFLPDDSVRISDKVAGRDDTDTLKGIDIGAFSNKSVNLGPGQDIAFVIDTTGSMYDDIDAVKARSGEIISAIFDGEGGFINSRIAVVGYNDPDTNTFLSFTEQPKIEDRKSAAVNAINSISVGGGGDFPEAVNAGLIRALSGGAGEWREEAIARRIILFGDAPPNDTALRSQVLQLAADVGATLEGSPMMMSLESDITTSTVTNGLAVTSFSLKTTNTDGTTTAIPVQIFTVLIGSDPTTRDDFNSLATATGGKSFFAEDASKIVDALIKAINTPLNGTVVANDDTSFTANTLIAKTIDTSTLLANDTAPDASDVLTVAAVNNAVGGSVFLDGLTVVFNVDDNFTGTASFDYTIDDGKGNVDTANVSIEVGQTFEGTNKKDDLLGTNFGDVLLGKNHKDFLKGLDGDDYISGGNKKDTLVGGAGDDYLVGGDDQDVLVGGGGKDIFVLETNGNDVITDFQDGIDLMGLSNGLSFGQLTFSTGKDNSLIIKKDRDVLAVLEGVDFSAITANDFTQVV